MSDLQSQLDRLSWRLGVLADQLAPVLRSANPEVQLLVSPPPDDVPELLRRLQGATETAADCARSVDSILERLVV